VRRVGADEIPA